ncbi:unnamed protein product [Amaranthus hypochondriacus]
MAHAKVFILLLFILMILPIFSVESTPERIEDVNYIYIFNKDGMPKIKSRKLLEGDLVQLDYDYAGPNPKHDPKRGRGGGRNP